MSEGILGCQGDWGEGQHFRLMMEHTGVILFQGLEQLLAGGRVNHAGGY